MNNTTLLILCVNYKGWKIERQLETLHCTVLPSHTLESADDFLTDLKEACRAVKVPILLLQYL